MFPDPKSRYLTLSAASLLPGGAVGKIVVFTLMACTKPLSCSLSDNVAANSTPE